MRKTIQSWAVWKAALLFPVISYVGNILQYAVGRVGIEALKISLTDLIGHALDVAIAIPFVILLRRGRPFLAIVALTLLYGGLQVLVILALGESRIPHSEILPQSVKTMTIYAIYGTVLLLIHGLPDHASK